MGQKGHMDQHPPNWPFHLPPEAIDIIPAHGWLRSVTGLRHLRLPIMQMFQPTGPTFIHFQQAGLAGQWLQFRSPYRTLRQLAVALRDLHLEVRLLLPLVEGEWSDREPSSERNDTLTRLREGFERIEISLIAIFVLLRRLADELIDASRPVLFEHWQSAPRQLKTLMLCGQNGGLARFRPRYDVGVLTDALQTQLAWFSQLRQDDGIRDILVHKDHLLQVGSAGHKTPTDEAFVWRINAALIRSKRNGITVIQLFPSLMDCMRGACRFMDKLHLCAIQSGRYGTGDVLPLTGSDNDIVGFWPSILESPQEFPLMD